MANILLLETATDTCSVAIAENGQVLALAEVPQLANPAGRLTLLIQDLVQQTGIPLSRLDAVALSRGPGSYTSLRVGASVAKGICYALDKPLIAVDTLQALAWGSRAAWAAQAADVPLFFVPMLDARRQEVWTAIYDAGLNERVPAQPLILSDNLFYEFLETSALAQPGAVFVVPGNGAEKTENVPLPENVALSLVRNCSAAYLARLAEDFFQKSDFQEVSYFEPFYMKQPNITTPNKPGL
ncbi:MAG: tRNA (adenosine(37)-N6)-threonylcarbamoyltransferase complex dimerization subunit type 1 TsaB [Saprospiraceae bacterium]|nr:tRNA (adenosine(37)-N6)-threonylcarbamoyltransferase complex dimerization subunit type 1 TsaB [Saprospiraceae bacterium]